MQAIAPTLRLAIFAFAFCACSETAPVDDGAGGAGGASGQAAAQGGSGGVAGALSIADSSFGELSAWANPIDDYLQAGKAEVGSDDFLRGIQDLAVFEDRLYLSYGDANHNLGRIIPIGLRFFADPDDATASNEFDTDEEQIEQYRHLDGELWAAGVDATEDAWLGNVYVRGAGGTWTKHRTVQGGVHVHDVASFGGAHYAVGLGATEAEWGQGNIYAHFWRTKDGGASFEIVERAHNGGSGDARWVKLLSLGGELFAFGYTSNAEYKIDNLIGGHYDGSTWSLFAEGHPLRWFFAVGTDQVSGDRGIVRGVDLKGDPLVHAVWTVDDAASATMVSALAEMTVVDVFHHPATDETLFLTYDGNDYKAGFTLSQWTVRVLVSRDLLQFDEKLSFTTQVAPQSIAYWRGALFYGNGDGQVLRATAAE
jgi:hypothetical protein